MKSKGEEECYTRLNAEFQKIARREKKAFLVNKGSLCGAQSEDRKDEMQREGPISPN